MLNLLSSAQEGLSLSKIASLSNMSPATANRYLFTLKELSYVVQDPSTKKLNLTPKILNLGFPFIRNMNLRSRLLPHMLELTRELDVTTQCAILNGTEIVYVERIRSTDVVNLDLNIGSRLPAYCTSLGRAILAFMDKSEARRVIARMTLVKHTPYTITEKSRLKEELDKTRRRGYAINSQELTIGSKTFAVPVFKNGTVEGAVGVTFPVQRVKDSYSEEVFVEKLKQVSQKASI